MKNLVLIFCFIFSPNLIFSQSDWVQTNGPYGGSMKFIGQDWNGNIFAGSQIGYPYLGYFYRSLDKAQNWERISREISSIAFRKDSTYVIGNINGDIYLYGSDFKKIKQIKKSEGSIFSEMNRLFLDSLSNIFVERDYMFDIYSTDNGKTWIKLKKSNFTIDSANQFYSFEDNYFVMSKDIWKTWDTLAYVSDSSQGYSSSSLIYNKKYNSFFGKYHNNEIIIFRQEESTWKGSSVVIPLKYPICLYLDFNGDIYCFKSNYYCKSTDGGFTWKLFEIDLPFNINHCIKEGNYFYFAVSGKSIIRYDIQNNTYKQMNNGLIFSSTSNLCKSKKGNIFVETQQGIYSTSNSGNSWEHIEIPQNSYNSNHIFCSKFGNIYVSNETLYNSKNGILISSDEGKTWGVSYLDVSDIPNSVFAESENGRLFIGKRSLYYSDDFGKTWNKTNTFTGGIYALATYQDKYLLVGTYSDGAYLSEDAGITFRKLPFGIPEQEGSDIVFNSKGDMFINLNDYNFQDVIYRSTDMGKTFKNIHPYSLGWVGILKIDKNDNLYLVNGDSLYYSTDNGDSFKSMSGGILDTLVKNDIFFDENQRAYLATQYDGVYRTDNFTEIKENEESNNNSDIIFPNPASDFIIVDSPSIKRGLGGVSEPIKIFNIFGEYVLTVETQNFVSLQKIDISALPAGVYFVRIGDRNEKFVKINN